MVKKITVYTAFGQFLGMVERQAELEKEQNKEMETDRYPVEHLLSDYQNALTSVHDFRVQSCPADFSFPIIHPVKKSISCPIAAFASSENVDPIQKMAVSPVPTTIETRKLNIATELMLSFWKVHITERKQKMDTEDIPSLFEKIEGLFVDPSTTSIVSLFGKFEELFEDQAKQKKIEELLWTSPDQPLIPQLPVFVRSPVDSLKIYSGSHKTIDYMADNESTSTLTSPPSSTESLSPISSSASSSSSSTTIISKPNMLLTEIRLQRAVIDEQQKIIDSLYNLQMLNRNLAKLHKEL